MIPRKSWAPWFVERAGRKPRGELVEWRVWWGPGFTLPPKAKEKIA